MESTPSSPAAASLGSNTQDIEISRNDDDKDSDAEKCVVAVDDPHDTPSVDNNATSIGALDTVTTSEETHGPSSKPSTNDDAGVKENDNNSDVVNQQQPGENNEADEENDVEHYLIATPQDADLSGTAATPNEDKDADEDNDVEKNRGIAAPQDNDISGTAMVSDVEMMSNKKEPTQNFASMPHSNDHAATISKSGSQHNSNKIMSSPTPPTMTIEHTVVPTNRSATVGLIFGMSKPIFTLVMGTILALTGALTYFAMDHSTLTTEIRELEAQVLELGDEINRLSTENDRFALLNGDLNQTAYELEQVVQQLNATTIQLEMINDDLNATNLALEDQVDRLTEQNSEFSGLNEELNATAIDLSMQLETFQEAVAALILGTAEQAGLAVELGNITELLLGVTQDQNMTLDALELTFDGLVDENSRLETLSRNLAILVQFLNETFSDLDVDLDRVTTTVAEQITINTVLVSQSVEQTYHQLLLNWDCDYRTIFREREYGADFDAIIPESEYDVVLQYVDDRVWSELCFASDDFARYLLRTNGTETTTELTSN